MQLIAEARFAFRCGVLFNFFRFFLAQESRDPHCTQRRSTAGLSRVQDIHDSLALPGCVGRVFSVAAE